MVDKPMRDASPNSATYVNEVCNLSLLSTQPYDMDLCWIGSIRKCGTDAAFFVIGQYQRAELAAVVLGSELPTAVGDAQKVGPEWCLLCEEYAWDGRLGYS